MKPLRFFRALFLLLASFAFWPNTYAQRKTISLNGIWQIAETSPGQKPQEFTRTVPVPGLIDMAIPKLPDVKRGADSLRYFWYKRSFSISKKLTQHVFLEIKKAAYSKQLFINGHEVNIKQEAFSSSQTDIRQYLKSLGQGNELLLRLGTIDNFPDTMVNGGDFEKKRFLPGIFDDVNLILTDGPVIQNIQVVPDVIHGKVKVVAIVNSYGKKGKQQLLFTIMDELNKATTTKGGQMNDLTGGIDTLTFEAKINNYKLWTPENPFLYELTTSIGNDNLTTRFGMRSFKFDSNTKTAMLNNEIYYLRGTNVPVYRFFEDSLRADLPWNRQWVKLLFTRFKEMHWNIVRFHVGPAPQFWYDIADEMGMLIQDEYAIWGGKGGIRKSVTPEHIALEYTRWMQERWNHPCIVIWDGQNETVAKQTAIAINKVRHLDLSNRPWDNGYSAPASKDDPIEAHPYLFYPYHLKDAVEPPEGLLKHLLGEKRIPSNDPNEQDPSPDGKRYNNAIVLNEYAWLWVNRDGSPTTLSENVYKNFFKDVVTNVQRIEKCARLTAALTEYWRAYRTSAAVMYFAGLSYSRPHEPRGETSDLLQDVAKFKYWPQFTKYMRSAFSPVGLMVEAWEKSYSAGQEITVPVHVINDLKQPWKGNLALDVFENDQLISHQVLVVNADRYKVIIENFKVKTPTKAGVYKLIGRINYKGEIVESVRDMLVVK